VVDPVNGSISGDRRLNSLESLILDLEVPGLVELQVSAPSYISYAHYQNQALVGANHAVRALAAVSTAGIDKDLSLRLVLRSQGRDISKPAFLLLKSEAMQSGPAIMRYELDGDFLFEVREATPATFEFSILSGADEVATGSIQTELFPPDLWALPLGAGLGVAGNLLTTFVRPRDPALDPILTTARNIKATFSSPEGRLYRASTAGYQGDDDEVIAEVRALYEAVQKSGVQYSNPANSEDWTFAQIIRSNAEILNAKAATCLDSTVLFASLLENIGIRPVLALIPGHAFVGFWTSSGQNANFSSGIAETEEAIQHLRAQPARLYFVETTLMCQSANQVSFEKAVTSADARITSSLLKSEGNPELAEKWRLIDVSSSRRMGYRPLASKVKNADGTSTIVEYAIENRPSEMQISVEVAKVGTIADTSPPRVRAWKNQLLDLTFNNPLLNMRRRSASQVKLFVPKGRLGNIEDFLQQQKAELRLFPGFTLEEKSWSPLRTEADGTPSPELDTQLQSNFADNKRLLFEMSKVTKQMRGEDDIIRTGFSRIRTLATNSKASIQETGQNNLYMTFGSLRWKRADAASEKDAYVVSPLILLPITLRPIDKGKSWAIALDDSNDVATNETLAMKLMSDYQISIPALTAPAQDAAGIDIPGLIEAVRIAITEAKQSSWVVSEDSTIGTYDFSTFHIWKDLNDNWEKLAEAPLVKHLISTDGSDAFVDPNETGTEISEEELDIELSRVPVPTDGTQLRAIVKSLRGESFIIQGPPGTGKSQTITNLLARNLQAGRKVLFMSEKPAALEVVKSRLDEIKLGAFVLDLHSKNTSSAEIRNQLLTAMDANPRIDTSGIEASNFDFEVATKALAKYPERLHLIHPTHGESVYSVRDKFLLLPETSDLKLSRAALSYFTKERVTSFLSSLKGLQDTGEQSGASGNNSWSFSNLEADKITTEFRQELSSLVSTAVSGAKALISSSALRAITDKVMSYSDLAISAGVSVDAPAISDLRGYDQLETKQKLAIHKAELERLISSNSESFAKPGLASAPIAELESALSQAVGSMLFKKKKANAVAKDLEKYINEPVSDITVTQLLEKAKLLQGISKKASETGFGLPGLAALPVDEVFEPGRVANRLSRIAELESLLEVFRTSPDSSSIALLELSQEQRLTLSNALKSIQLVLDKVCANDESITLWLSGRTFSNRLELSIEKWETQLIDSQFLELVRWVNLLELVTELETAGEHEARKQILSGEVGFSEAPKAFEKAYFRNLFEKLLDDHGLGNFDSAAQNSNIKKLKQATDSLRIYNRDTIAGAVVQSRTFDPTAVAGKAGALRSEINKQKGQLSVRQLMKKYWETITEITPCVAASPDSVARFLDVNLAHFDLIVFDEASQLRVPNSIGALGRGKSAVIVGDSKQMPPTNLFSSNKEEEDENEDVPTIKEPDVESILTMAEFSKLPEVKLKWHYRSQDESLIAFSNKEYYLDELASFPSPVDKGDSQDRAIRFEFVPGAEYVRSKTKASRASKPEESASEEVDNIDEFTELEEQPELQTNTNSVEAERVVAYVKELFEKQGAKLNLGIVTMNEQQGRLIRAKLQGSGDPELVKLMDEKIDAKNYLFVRALEKVQGDERDIILMSIGFARVPDPKSPNGFKVPQNFGPLTKVGSERRLNVAVTRARQKVVVFCSFEPEDLRISETSSLGMSGLKDYMMLAKYGPNGVGLANRTTFAEPERHRIDIAKAIEAMGYRTTQNLGLSNFKIDIAVGHPDKENEYVMAILLDGPTWKSRPTTNDRDVLPTGVLQSNMGWTSVERIWLPVWLKDKEGELARIEARIKEVLATPTETEQEDVDLDAIPDFTELVMVSEEPVKVPETLNLQSKSGVGVNIDDIEIYAEIQPWLVTNDKSHIQYTNHPEVQRVIGDVIAALTSVEGPIHPDRAVSFIAKCFGLSHVKGDKATKILTAIPRSRFTRDSEGFIFPDGVGIGGVTSWRRKDTGNPRDIALISLTELGNAMRDLCARTHGLEHEELMRQTLMAFGQKTLGAIIRKRLELAIETALQRKVLLKSQDHYEAAAD
jgi:hypothetical protein